MPHLAVRRRARRALERQLEYQRRKSLALQGHENEIMDKMARRSMEVRDKLEKIRPFSLTDRVLEVGSGAHGLIFFFPTGERIGIDPLADHYRTLFPVWQGHAHTQTAFGEQLPFADGSMDVVLCDNVVDHAESPRRIVEEISRVLTPGGLLYFTVNVHHRLYEAAAAVHSAWRAIGIPFEITPFADHTVHLTVQSARALFMGLPLQLVAERDTITETREQGPKLQMRHAGDQLKRWFFKNAIYEVIATRSDASAATAR